MLRLPTFSPPLAVVDAVDDKLIIWHVKTGPDRRRSRLSGAWVVDNDQPDTIRTLVHNRPAIHCTSTVVLPQGITSSALIDVNATVRSMRAEIATADRRFIEHAAAVKHSLIRPDWPIIHHPTAAPSATAAPGNRIRAALALAYGIAELADAWARFESLRLTRKYLVPLGGPSARPLPLEEIR